MFHECLEKTNSLSSGKIKQINYILKNPLRADFSIFSAKKMRKLVENIVEVQRQCNEELEALQLNAADHEAIEINAYVSQGKRLMSKKLSFPDGLRNMKMTTLEMVREDLHRYGVNSEKIGLQTTERLVALYLLTEALVLLECGVCTLNVQGNTFTLKKTEKFERALHTHWFASMVTVISKRFDMIDFQKIISDAHSCGTPALQFIMDRPDILSYLTMIQVDKTLSLNYRFLHSLPLACREPMADFIERARVATLFTLIWTEFLLERKGKTSLDAPIIKLSHNGLQKLKIPQRILDDLIFLNSGKTIHNKIFSVLGDDLYKLGTLSNDQMLVQYCSEKLLEYGSLFGKWFETGYIASCIESDVPKSRYRVYLGGESKLRSKEKYDIDLIIEDVEADRLLLCQVKHRNNTELPYFRSHWHEFFMGSSIKSGLRQLASIAKSFDNSSLVDMIKTRTGRRDISSDYLRRRSSLVLIHNINGLGFGKYQDFLLYDWPTLRNLLRRQMGKSNGSELDNLTMEYSTRVPIEDIELTISHLSRNLLNEAGGFDLENDWNIFRNANLKIDWYAKATNEGWLANLRRRRSVVFPFT